MLKQEHYYGDRIYKIGTIVGTIDRDDIKEVYFVGYTKYKDTKKLNVIYEYLGYYGTDYFIEEKDYLLFDTKEDAEQNIGLYNNGKQIK